MPRAGGGVDDLQSLRRDGWYRTGCGARARSGRDVPRIVVDDGAYGARGPIHHAKRVRPDGEYQIAGAAEKGLVDDELVVAVLVQALAARCRRGARGACAEPDRRRTRSIRARAGGTADGSRCAETESMLAAPFRRSALTIRPRLGAPQACPAKRGGEPLAIGADRALAELRARHAKIRRSARVARSMRPQIRRRVLHELRPALAPSGCRAGGVRMDRRAARQLARFRRSPERSSNNLARRRCGSW